jgi:hypothetical protein
MEESRQKLRQLSCLFDNLSDDNTVQQSLQTKYVEQMNIINEAISSCIETKNDLVIFRLPDKMLNTVEDELISNGWDIDVPRLCQHKGGYQYMMMKK